MGNQYEYRKNAAIARHFAGRRVREFAFTEIALLLTTRRGGSKTVAAKLLSSALFVTGVCAWFWLLDFLAFGAIFGSFYEYYLRQVERKCTAETDAFLAAEFERIAGAEAVVRHEKGFGLVYESTTQSVRILKTAGSSIPTAGTGCCPMTG